jgi:uncharacterized protein (TIGR03435 family)
VTILVLLAGIVFAQTGPLSTSFEVASVKRLAPGSRGSGPLRGGPGTGSPGRLSGTATLKALLMRAYELKEFQIAGPDWMGSERYEIDAKVPEGAAKEQVASMLRALLAERFHLETHRENRELPIYALVTAKNGPKFKETATGADESATAASAPKIVAGPNGYPQVAAGTKLSRSYEIVVAGSDGVRYQLFARQETMEHLASVLSGPLSRTVVDMTNLKGEYDFSLIFAVETPGGTIPRTGPPPDMIEAHPSSVIADDLTVFAALEKQLGLKLEPRKSPATILVIDKVEKAPTGN